MAPAGTLIEVTVCWSASRSFQIIVLFTPTTTVILDGWKLRDSLLPTPNGIVIWFVELKVLLDVEPVDFELELLVVVAMVPPVEVEVAVELGALEVDT